MKNPYYEYYLNQSGKGYAVFRGAQTQRGHGMTVFRGMRTQRGHGFFGRLFSGVGSFIKDLLPSLGKRALPSAISLAQDIASGENVVHSAKRRMKEAGKNMADETLDRLKSRLQGGRGKRGGRGNKRNRKTKLKRLR